MKKALLIVKNSEQMPGFLKRIGFDVICGEINIKEIPDILIMDFNEDLFKRIKRISKDIYIFTFIPNNDPDLIIKSFNAGSDDVLKKPVDYEELYKKAGRLFKIEYKDKFYIRKDCRLPIKFIVKYRIGDTFLKALSEDISVGGIAIKVSYPPENRSKIELEFSLPGKMEVIKVIGEIAWVEPEVDILRRIGIKFININERDKELISNFIKEA